MGRHLWSFFRLRSEDLLVALRQNEFFVEAGPQEVPKGHRQEENVLCFATRGGHLSVWGLA